MAQAMASFVGVGLSQSMRSRRSMIERHLQRVNPALKGFALRRAVQSSFDSYARYWVESFKVPSLSKQAVARAFSTQGFDEHVGGALEQGKGAILALPHLGGWEWAGRWLADQGHTVTVVVEPLDNQEVFDWFVDLRSKLGMHVVPLGPGAAAAIVRALKANEIVCLLSDRDISRNGIEVEFFGERTTLPGGPATMALRTGAALLPTATYFTDALQRSSCGRAAADPDRTARHAARGRHPHHAAPRPRARAPHRPGSRAMAPVPAELAIRPRILRLI